MERGIQLMKQEKNTLPEGPFGALSCPFPVASPCQSCLRRQYQLFLAHMYKPRNWWFSGNSSEKHIGRWHFITEVSVLLYSKRRKFHISLTQMSNHLDIISQMNNLLGEKLLNIISCGSDSPVRMSQAVGAPQASEKTETCQWLKVEASKTHKK